MNLVAQQILDNLREVERLRQQRRNDTGHACKCLALKAYQAARFRCTYEDLLSDAEYAKPAMFFLNDLYGPQDFERRDSQFARVVPAIGRLFKDEVLATVHQLSELHRISEQLDTEMANHLNSARIDRADYLRAWQLCGDPEQRRKQIELTCALGAALKSLTRRKVLRVALRLMRGPAHAAGLSDLQDFLEAGFDIFAQMSDPDRFLDTIRDRESQMAIALFDAPMIAKMPRGSAVQGPLRCLPDAVDTTEATSPKR